MALDPQEKKEMEDLREEVNRLKRIIDENLGSRTEILGQVVVSQVVVKSPTAARTLLIRTTQGEYNVLAE